MPKINIPMGLNEGEQDLTDESKYLTTLIYKADRTTTGVGIYTSTTSNIVYSTDDYPNDESIYNKGEVGLIHLFWKLYGGADGFLELADDANSYVRPSGDTTTSGELVPSDADTLGGNPPSYYLDYNNLTNTPTLTDYAITSPYTLLSSSWAKVEDYFQQQINITDFRFQPSSQVDFDADLDNLGLLNNTIIPFNDNGTVYARTLNPPTSDVVIQITIRKITKTINDIELRLDLL